MTLHVLRGDSARTAFYLPYRYPMPSNLIDSTFTRFHISIALSLPWFPQLLRCLQSLIPSMQTISYSDRLPPMPISDHLDNGHLLNVSVFEKEADPDGGVSASGEELPKGRSMVSRIVLELEG